MREIRGSSAEGWGPFWSRRLPLRVALLVKHHLRHDDVVLRSAAAKRRTLHTVSSTDFIVFMCGSVISSTWCGPQTNLHHVLVRFQHRQSFRNFMGHVPKTTNVLRGRNCTNSRENGSAEGSAEGSSKNMPRGSYLSRRGGSAEGFRGRKWISIKNTIK